MGGLIREVGPTSRSMPALIVFWVQRGACMIGRLPRWASRPEHPQPPFLVWWTPNVRSAFRRLWIDEGFNAVYS